MLVRTLPVLPVDAGKFYALDEANYELIEVTHTSDVAGVAHYEIVSGGEEITLTDAAGVEAFETQTLLRYSAI